MLNSKPFVAIIGAGPAGLMAAEMIANAGYSVSVFDAMPSVGRKFLLAGVGGMNITHSEPHAQLLTRYFDAGEYLKAYLDPFSSDELRSWIHQLGVETFTGTSGRVFPKEMKAAPLLRKWVHRLKESGVQFFTRHQWKGWNNLSELQFTRYSTDNKLETLNLKFDASVLALGGASWPQLGSTGNWVNYLREKTIDISPLKPSNCGFNVNWSEEFKREFSGQPLNTIGLHCEAVNGIDHYLRGEVMLTNFGIEGTSIYAVSSYLRDKIAVDGQAVLHMDLLPDYSEEKIIQLLSKDRKKNSISNFMRKQLNLSLVKLALLRELTDKSIYDDIEKVATAIKKLPVSCISSRPIEEAISSAGGIQFEELSNNLMLKKLPGIFCAGEMLNWEAPTGGYLLTACFATGRAAGLGVVEYLQTEYLEQ